MRALFVLLVALILLAAIGQSTAEMKPQFISIVIAGLILSALTVMDLEWGLYILIFVIPFTLQYRMGVNIAFGTDDIFLILLIFSWLANRARSKEQIFVDTPLNWAFILFFISGALSLTQAISKVPPYWFKLGILHLFRFFEYVFIYFIVVSCIKDLSQVKKFTIAFFINVGVVAVIQIVQNMIGGELTKGIFWLPGGAVAVHYGVSTFTSNATLGAFYCFAISIALGLIVTVRSVRTKVVLIIFSIVISFTLFNTYSRSAYVGIMMGIFVVAALKDRRIFILFLAILVLSPIFMQSLVMTRVAMTFPQAAKPSFNELELPGPYRFEAERYRVMTEGRENIKFDPSAEIRLLIWSRAFDQFLRYPILGVGWWAGRWVLQAEPHSQFWEYILDTGILGFGIFLWLIIGIFKISSWVRNNASDDFTQGLTLGYTAGFAALLATCVFSETLDAFRVLGPLWFMTALMASVRNILLEQKEAPQDIR